MRAIIVAATLTLTGCAGIGTGSHEYSEPSDYSTNNTKVVPAGIDDVWKRAIPEIGKNFFVINNMDKDSGVINLSYSGNPSNYVDCGTLVASSSDMFGTRNYDVNLADARSAYEITYNTIISAVDRQMDLDGRINLIFQSEGSASTRVTANVKYVVRQKLTIANQSTTYSSMNIPTRDEASIGFNTGGGDAFPWGKDMLTVSCKANGKLEKELLDLVQ